VTTRTEEDLMRGRTIVIAGLAAIVTALGVVTSFGSSGETSAASRTVPPDPADFDAPVANPYFPLEPGTIFHYRGTEGRDRLHERLTITDRAKTIQGITTTVVRDVLFANGLLAEKTLDWYANDNDGNVWYFGEATATYDEHGHVESTEGSWEAGVHGAVPGTIMPAHPGPADAYRQEFWRGHAEDQAWIVQRGLSLRIPYGRVDHVLRSFEWTRLESNVISVKFYAPGLGIVTERDLRGGSEHLELARVTTPRVPASG
jgi:hypothetical protein